MSGTGPARDALEPWPTTSTAGFRTTRTSAMPGAHQNLESPLEVPTATGMLQGKQGGATPWTSPNLSTSSVVAGSRLGLRSATASVGSRAKKKKPRTTKPSRNATTIPSPPPTKHRKTSFRMRDRLQATAGDPGRFSTSTVPPLSLISRIYTDRTH